jgi:hypothetical protein
MGDSTVSTVYNNYSIESLLTLKAATTAAGSTSPSNLTSHTTGAIITGALSSRKRRFFSFKADTPTSTLGDNAYIKLYKTFLSVYSLNSF